MKQSPSTARRILAVDPYSRGFGFVVLEGPDRLVDWGLRDARHATDTDLVAKVEDLIALYRPGLLVVEDCAHRSSRRRTHGRQVVRKILKLAETLGVRTRPVSAAQVRSTFAADGATTKHAIAGLLVARFPELAPHRPRFRKPWMSEDERQAIFDAAGWAMVVLRSWVSDGRIRASDRPSCGNRRQLPHDATRRTSLTGRAMTVELGRGSELDDLAT